MREGLIPAIICYFTLVALFYLVSAIALIIWKFAIAPAIVYLSDRNIEKKLQQQPSFDEQIKQLLADS